MCNHVPRIYRKVNAILREVWSALQVASPGQVKVRADVYIFRARSLEDAIDSDAADTRTATRSPCAPRAVLTSEVRNALAHYTNVDSLTS